MPSLDELARKYGTDKSTLGHGYTTIYESYFGSLRLSAIWLLEIGVQNGNSLRMWREYFDRRAAIMGLDIRATSPIDGCEVFQGDQREWVPENGVRFDIIIDDGSHNWEDQIGSFENLWPLLNPGGIYCIEDLQTSYMSGYGNGVSGIQRIFSLVDQMNLTGNMHQACRDGDFPNEIEFIHFYRFLGIVKKRMQT